MDKDLLQSIFGSNGWDTVDVGVLQFYDVTFQQDFGAFQAGTHCGCLLVDFLNGKFESLDTEGKVTQTVNFELRAK